MAYIDPGGGGRTSKSTLDLLKEVRGIAIYGLLLSPPEHPISEVVRKKWHDFHYLTGTKFLLVTLEPPSEIDDNIKNYWKSELGDKFEKFWEGWESERKPGVATSFCDKFEPKLKISQLPCLVLFTSPENLEDQRIVVRSLPEWNNEALFQLLSGMIESIRDCCDKPIEKRLKCLQNSLTSPNAICLSYYKHMKTEVLDYMQKNPTSIVVATAAFVLALSGNVISLGAAAFAILEAKKSWQK